LYRFIIDFELQKFREKKLQMVITFDRELGLKGSKNESCSKWDNEVCGKSSKGIMNPNFFPKFHCLLFFYFISIFDIFFFSVSHIYKCQKILEIYCGVSLYGLEIYQRILKNSNSFFLNRDITLVVSNNRYNMVDTTSVGSHN